MSKIVSVNLKEDENYKTIVAFLAVCPDQTLIPEETVFPSATKGCNGQTAMYVSYAKDILIANIEAGKVKDGEMSLQMHNAVAVVKEAKGALE